jgi:hypothetical protein
MHPTTLSHLVAQHTAELHAAAVDWRLVRQAKATSGHRRTHERRRTRAGGATLTAEILQLRPID